MKKAKEVQCYVGIDVSKQTLDVCLLTNCGEQEHKQFENSMAGFKEINSWLRDKDFFSIKKSLFCMEHTGLYTRQLVAFLLEKQANVWMESALHLKRSMGMVRG